MQMPEAVLEILNIDCGGDSDWVLVSISGGFLGT